MRILAMLVLSVLPLSVAAQDWSFRFQSSADDLISGTATGIVQSYGDDGPDAWLIGDVENLVDTPLPCSEADSITFDVMAGFGGEQEFHLLVDLTREDDGSMTVTFPELYLTIDPMEPTGRFFHGAVDQFNLKTFKCAGDAVDISFSSKGMVKTPTGETRNFSLQVTMSAPYFNLMN